MLNKLFLSVISVRSKLEKVAIATHCIFSPVVLGFNYEAHDASAYKYNHGLK